MYKLRIDTSKRNDVVKLLSKYASLWIVSYEGFPDNPHCHVYLHLLCKQATLRNRIRKDFSRDKVAGNALYSLKELDEEYPLEYLAYLVKEKDYQKSDNFPQDKLDEALAHDKKVKEEMKEKKKNRLPVWKKIMEMCKDVQYDKDAYRKIAESVVDYHQENQILVRRFALKSYTDTIYLQKFPQFARYDLVKWIIE